MLFILRQIREATTPAIDDTDLFPQPPMVEEPEEDPIPDFRRLPLRPAANTIIPEPGSVDSVVSRRITEQFGILFWVVILVGGLIWNAYIIMSHMRDNLIPTAVANTVAQAPAPAAGMVRQFGPLQRADGLGSIIRGRARRRVLPEIPEGFAPLQSQAGRLALPLDYPLDYPPRLMRRGPLP